MRPCVTFMSYHQTWSCAQVLARMALNLCELHYPLIGALQMNLTLSSALNFEAEHNTWDSFSNAMTSKTVTTNLGLHNAIAVPLLFFNSCKNNTFRMNRGDAISTQVSLMIVLHILHSFVFLWLLLIDLFRAEFKDHVIRLMICYKPLLSQQSHVTSHWQKL
jgi:hypothetical protein